MRTLRFWVRLSREFFFRFKKYIFLAALLGGVVFLLFFLSLPHLPKPKPTEIIGVTGRFSTETLPESILRLVSTGLTKTTQTAQVEPSLASSWETTDSGKTWIFHIDLTKVWQDGTPVKAKDINYNFSDVKVSIENDQTLIFELNEPFVSFPSIVSRPVFKKGLLGTGEFKVTKISFEGSVINRLNLTSKTQNKLFKFYPNDDALTTAFKLGQVDVVEEVLEASEFRNWKNVNIDESVNKQRYVAAFLNYNDPSLDKENKSIRQALSYAINKDKLSQNRASGPIPSSSWAFNPLAKQYSYDPKRAKDLIDELPQAQKEKLSLSLVTIPSLLLIAEQVAQDWRAIGIDTRVQVVSVVPQDFQAFLAVQEVPDDPDQYALWHSTQIETGTNITKYNNVRIDKLLEDGRKTLEADKRKQIYFDFQRFLLEDPPAIFLYHPTTYKITRKL